jgi:hypothetical protein
VWCRYKEMLFLDKHESMSDARLGDSFDLM